MLLISTCYFWGCSLTLWSIKVKNSPCECYQGNFSLRYPFLWYLLLHIKIISGYFHPGAHPGCLSKYGLGKEDRGKPNSHVVSTGKYRWQWASMILGQQSLYLFSSVATKKWKAKAWSSWDVHGSRLLWSSHFPRRRIFCIKNHFSDFRTYQVYLVPTNSHRLEQIKGCTLTTHFCWLNHILCLPKTMPISDHYPIHGMLYMQNLPIQLNLVNVLRLSTPLSLHLSKSSHTGWILCCIFTRIVSCHPIPSLVSYDR